MARGSAMAFSLALPWAALCVSLRLLVSTTWCVHLPSPSRGHLGWAVSIPSLSFIFILHLTIPLTNIANIQPFHTCNNVFCCNFCKYIGPLDLAAQPCAFPFFCHGIRARSWKYLLHFCTPTGFYLTNTDILAMRFFVENIKLKMDKWGVVGTIVLDLKKAFDTVNHQIFIRKLISLLTH